ncbi:hypothetical protein K469DRAFT_160360 [Zopfia rhizophila CBS 207.26]|uniref:Uncharacterized protein n=1 Tax=Zopfia rhizophila CBS 207.26 TaxID=1314779 RepID=A0A6A6E0X1_9PEZI|nr:hypothetical protein K469DRAFT_160360 [Zopfia rhizophila CBS 207.26]
MLTMAHLFGRQYCRQADVEYIEEIVKRSPSIVFLPLPKKAANILRKHNSSTLKIFTAYVQTFVEQHLTEPDNTLPLTRIKIGGNSNETQNVPKYLPHHQPPTVRSSFVALSGHDDNFASIHDLCTTSRSGVFLEEAVVPYVGLYHEEFSIPLNAYLYDFFMHGDTTAIVTANRIRRGDIWFMLNDFSLVLATIVTSLSNFMKLTPESDLDFADVRGEGEEADERQEDELMPEDSGYETASTIPTRTAKVGGNQQEMTARQKKKKVVDSWDDEDLEDEVEVENKNVKNTTMQDEEKPAWENGGLLNVLKAFRMLREEFDEKFRAIWA